MKVKKYLPQVNCEPTLSGVYKYSESFLLFAYNSAWNVSKYGVFSGPYFPIFGLNIGKYGPEKIPYLDTFHAV